jgi:hypothetical protein
MSSGFFAQVLQFSPSKSKSFDVVEEDPNHDDLPVLRLEKFNQVTEFMCTIQGLYSRV